MGAAGLLEAEPLSALGVTRRADVDRVTIRSSGALYVFSHRTLRTERLSVSRRDGRLRLEWAGRARVVPVGGEEAVAIETALSFRGVVVYADDPARASALLSEQFSAEGRRALPPHIRAPGRRKYLLFGPITGRVGWTRFVPHP